MKILGIDTSSKALSIAIHELPRIKSRITTNICGNSIKIRGDSCLIEESHVLDRRHSSLLVPKIREVLRKASLSIDDVAAFVVGVGPGSFTGLRIGVSTIKGLGIVTKRPCIGIPSIDALALNADGEVKTVCPVIDAKRGQVYSAIYKKEKSRVVRKTDYLLLGIDRLMKKVKGPAVFLGDGLELYRERIQRLNKNAVFLDEAYWYPQAGNLIRLAFGRIKRHKKMDLARLRPIYLYPEDCQVRKP